VNRFEKFSSSFTLLDVTVFCVVAFVTVKKYLFRKDAEEVAFILEETEIG
jgi:hypothetical protein